MNKEVEALKHATQVWGQLKRNRELVGQKVLEILRHPDATAKDYEAAGATARRTEEAISDAVTALRKKYPARGFAPKTWNSPEFDKYDKEFRR